MARNIFLSRSFVGTSAGNVPDTTDPTTKEQDMKPRISLLAAIALAFPLATLAAQPGHQQHGTGEHRLELNAGKKWTTDDALRKGMSSIRNTVAAALPSAHAGKATPADYGAIAKEMGTQVAYIVENCNLEPKADAQLHVVLEQIISGIDTVEGKGKERSREQGLLHVAQALNAYGKHFDHAGWEPIKLPH